MPKLNVYVPDELAEAVRTTGVPVSAICQRALEQSVRRVGAIRATVLGDLEHQDPTAGLSQLTDRARDAVRLAVGRARETGDAEVGTGHLLHGLLAEGGNLALRVLQAMEVDPEGVARALEAASPAGGDEPAERGDGPPATRFSGPAANALELTVVEALALGHNYVGCEHLLLGLAGEPDGSGGRVLRDRGVDPRSARRAVVAALTGFAHLRAKVSEPLDTGTAGAVAAVVRRELAPLVDRLDRLERQVGG